MIRLLTAASVVLCAACGSTPTTAAPPASPAATPAPNAEPDDQPITPPAGMRTYYVVLLRRGGAWTAEQTPEVAELGRGHMKHIAEMARAGHLIAAGPFLGQTDATDFAGIYIFDVKSLAEVKALTARDPAVAAGRFEPEYLIWMGAGGLRVNALTTAPTAAPAATKKPCEASEQRAFDFWIGDWSVTNPKGTIVGTNVISRAHKGCALIERWTSARGGTGSSTNYWDREKKKWVQLWVDGTGGVIHLEGNLVGAAMVLDGSYVEASGKRSRLRGTWTPNEDGSVRQLFEQSADGGKTWSVWFDGLYRRRGKSK